MKTDLTVAKTILAQIKAIDRVALMAYGAKDYIGTDNSIQFKVKGLKHKGFVRIALDYATDTYTIKAWRVRAAKITEVANVDGVYCDYLVSVLDEIVEGK